jgi:hypothetical protein
MVPRVEGKVTEFLTLDQYADRVGDTAIGLLALARPIH